MTVNAETATPPVWTVTSLTAAIKGRLESEFRLVDVEGEISGWRVYPSGHAYFTLKDEGAQISAVMFASAFAKAAGRESFKDGVKVKVRGSVSVYEPRGAYQIVVRRMKRVGEGELMQRYVELKAKLEKEGLFDAGRKRPLPYLPHRIGLVTSEAGAVVHDMCTVLTRRFPALEIRLFPCLVQGEAAPPTIIGGIRYFNDCPDWRADLVIVARGGGSFEDLFCFNDEALVREVAASRIPTISAVGHETDFTLCDFAADRRAGTPSIAAEIAVPRLDELRQRIADADARIVRALCGRGEWFAQRLDQLSESLGSALVLYRERVERRFERAKTRLELLSPYSVLERGYSLTTDASGEVLRDASAVRPGDMIVTRLCRGEIRSVV